MSNTDTPVKIKNARLVGVKAGPDDGLQEGEFVVYPSTFTREPDSYGDVVAKGAFLDDIKAWADSGDVLPGMYLHDPNQIVAAATDMGEDDHGWWVKGKFDHDPAAQRVYKWLKGRRLSSMSFAYRTLDEDEVELGDGRKANELRKVSALEFSFLPKGFAANSDTSVLAVKTAADALLSDAKASRALSTKSATTLREVQASLEDAAAQIKNVLPDLAGDDDSKAKADVTAKDEEPTGAKSEEPTPSTPVDLSALQAIELAALSGE